MPHHHERRVLPHSAAQMYDLVADVGRYPEFLPWVSAVRIRKNDESEMLADMIVGFKSLRETFSSRVIKDANYSIVVDYLDGPMKHLQNNWRFEDLPDGGSTVDFTVDFSFRNRVFEAIAGQFFDSALRKMTSAFIERADVLYGAGGSNSPKA
ncbi:type II toxin-antitoxin system RatA family toxin [Sphingorhabdus sp.]|uniref:type II toxin-antitoxin system RatA family toxin n=1 Tax=Sphingorhabdus sp. TaxID=1902408 RepID=UPI003593F9A9